MPSRLYSYFELTYNSGTTSIDQLRAAVTKGYITDIEYEQITGQTYVA